MTEVEPSFFQELKRYSLNKIRECLGCTSENIKAYINTLRKYGIVKIVKKESLDFADLTNDDIVIADSAEEVSGACYKFDFVGVVVVKDKVVFCYPKYTTSEDYKKIRDELKLAIKAIRKYDSKGEITERISINAFYEDSENDVYDENSEFTYNDEEITMDQYEEYMAMYNSIDFDTIEQAK